MKNHILKALTKTAESAAKSLLSSSLKKAAKDLFTQFTKRNQKDIEEEVIKSLGYLSTHFKLDKDQKIIYKPSAMFMFEFLHQSPMTSGRILKDEENGIVYFNDKPLTNTIKVDIIFDFVNRTKLQSDRLPYYFDAALKLFDVSDFTSSKFKKYFEGWDPSNESVIDNWMVKCFGSALGEGGTELEGPANSNLAYVSKLFRLWIIGVARRAIEPGSSLDGCLTLCGPPGVGKTRFFRELLPEPFDTRTGEIYCNIRSPQKFIESIIGKTIACFDELSVLEYAKSQEIFKQLLTSQFIDVRLVWRRDPQRYALRQGFGATSNKERFITDSFLSRRLWVVKLNNSARLNFDYVRENRKRLWQEAVYLALQGESCILSAKDQAEVDEHNKQYLVLK